MFHQFSNPCSGCVGSYCRNLGRLQSAADSVPSQRYVPLQTPSSACGCNSGCGCGCGCGSRHGGDARYYGYAAQEVAPGASLMLSRYSPSDDCDPSEMVYLPGGRYAVTYSVNASAAQAGASNTVTLGIAPQINGVAFPRGGSFATVPDDGSGTLSSTFIVSLPNAVNTLGFYNTGTLNTSYQLLNVTVTRVGC